MLSFGVIMYDYFHVLEGSSIYTGVGDSKNKTTRYVLCANLNKKKEIENALLKILASPKLVLETDAQLV